MPQIWKKEMEFPKTPLNDIHSGYSGTPEVWKEFFIEFIDNYEKFKGEYVEYDASDFSQLKSKYLIFMDNFNALDVNKLLDETDNKLGLTLPKSYRDFVLAGGVEISKNFIYNFLTYSDFFSINDVTFLHKDKKGYNSYQEIVEINNENYIENPKELEKSYKNYYKYPEYFNLFKYTDEDSNILDVLSRRKGDSEIGYFSRGILPEHEKFKKCVINLTGYLNRILLPFEQTQDGEYEAWFFEDVNFYRVKSFAEMYMVDLLGSCEKGLTRQGMKNLYRGSLSKMFVDMPSW